jgi:formylmethanofuran dehydrogenase subunit B
LGECSSSRPVRAETIVVTTSLEVDTGMTLNVVKHATCTFCGCVCDDIELHADGDRIVKAKNACSLGDAWFRNHTAEHLYPDALIDGEPATLDAAIEAAAEFLYAADMPLVYGLSNITCEAQREAAALAELVGGVVDSHTSL